MLEVPFVGRPLDVNSAPLQSSPLVMFRTLIRTFSPPEVETSLEELTVHDPPICPTAADGESSP
jgi:hypothetical protein